MQLNTALKTDTFTHEGAPAIPRLDPEAQLRRSVMSCLLWEREFYEDGVSIAERIVEAALACSPSVVARIAREARAEYNLRHVPLLLCSVLARTGSGTSLVSDTLADVIQRADELTEFVAVHAAVNGVTPNKVKPVMSAQVKKGLARAFHKFDAYQLAKYDRGKAVRLRDVLFLSHAKPANDEQAAVWKKLVEGNLEAPDTWEVSLSGGADKRETFERMLREGKLGYLALLRNLRNMDEAGVDDALIREAIHTRKGAHRVLPFRYVAAARACPRFEPEIDAALNAAIADIEPLPGKTAILVDVSGSMEQPLSARSDLTRMDAAAALAAIIPGDVRLFSFSAGNIRQWGDRWNGERVIVECPPRRGMAGIDAIVNSQFRGGTMLGHAVREINEIPHDRLIVITDEQSHDRVPDPKAKLAYMINVASYRNGVGYRRWTHIDGFSEQVLRFIREHEASRA